MKTLSKITLFFSVVAVTACSTHDKMSTKDPGNSAASRDSRTEPTKDTKYTIIVSFTSRGTGANSTQREAFLDYVKKHPKNIQYKTVLWGREGESDYCFKLIELTKSEQKEFISEVKKIVAGNDLIQVTEDAVCQHQGR